MAVLKSGDLVVLKSGSPVMTVDTVNTDIFDDNKITGILCAWFVGDKLERALRSCGADPRAIARFRFGESRIHIARGHCRIQDGPRRDGRRDE